MLFADAELRVCVTKMTMSPILINAARRESLCSAHKSVRAAGLPEAEEDGVDNERFIYEQSNVTRVMSEGRTGRSV